MRRIHSGISAVLSLAWKLGARSSDANHSTLLRSLLQRFPYWTDGHLAFAEEALARDAIAEAYAAAQVALILSSSAPRKQATAEFTLGRCFLRRGDWHSAVRHLSCSHTTMPHNHSVTEELAAAHILGGDYPAARTLLESIPIGHISAAGKAALSFTRSKIVEAPQNHSPASIDL